MRLKIWSHRAKIILAEASSGQRLRSLSIPLPKTNVLNVAIIHKHVSE